MSRKYTVKTNYNTIKKLIDTHKVYRGNNTSFCIDMGLENRTSWVSDLKRNRNLPSPEEAARMCILLNTTPEEILLHEGKTEAETVKCREDIKLVQELLEKEQSIKKAPADEGEVLDPKTKEILEFIDSASVEELDQVFRFVSYLTSQRSKKE